MAIEDRTGRIGNGLVQVVALDEHGIHGGDTAGAAARSGPF
jgi:hypothetical protein